MGKFSFMKNIINNLNKWVHVRYNNKYTKTTVLLHFEHLFPIFLRNIIISRKSTCPEVLNRSFGLQRQIGLIEIT